jgi:ABC-2 type transport system ATP-binding protein
MLAVTNLHKRFGNTRALAGFDLTARPGEVVGLIGHNGAGKSTLVTIVTGLTRPDAGTVHIDGRPAGRPQRRLIGVAPQTLGLYPTATVEEHLRLFGELGGLSKRQLRQAISDTAAELLLGDLLKRQARQLSGGQQRRVQAATALVHRPPLLLLDEPTVGADPETRDALLQALKRRADAGAAIVYTTHYLPELDDLDATLAVARRGRIVARGTRAELLAGVPGSVAATYPDGREVVIATSDPGAVLASLITEQLPSKVDFRSPSLDDLYRTLV